MVNKASTVAAAVVVLCAASTLAAPTYGSANLLEARDLSNDKSSSAPPLVGSATLTATPTQKHVHPRSDSLDPLIARGHAKKVPDPPKPGLLASPSTSSRPLGPKAGKTKPPKAVKPPITPRSESEVEEFDSILAREYGDEPVQVRGKYGLKPKDPPPRPSPTGTVTPRPPGSGMTKAPPKPKLPTPEKDAGKARDSKSSAGVVRSVAWEAEVVARAVDMLEEYLDQLD